MRHVIAAVCCALFIGCAQSESEAEPLMLEGKVQETTFGKACLEGNPNKVSGLRLVVRDGEGGIVGTTTTSGPDYEATDYESVCVVSADYSVQIEEADFYEIHLDGIARPLTYSRKELEARDFEVDIRIRD